MIAGQLVKKNVKRVVPMPITECNLIKRARTINYSTYSNFDFGRMWAQLGYLLSFINNCKCQACIELTNGKKKKSLDRELILTILSVGMIRSEISKHLNISIECVDRITDVYTELYQLLIHEHAKSGECACKRIRK